MFHVFRKVGCPAYGWWVRKTYSGVVEYWSAGVLENL
jgi:hypothetical protein